MSAHRPHTIVAACLFAWAVALAGAAAPPTEQPLLAGISAPAARELGRAADAAGLARIIAIGDPALVQSFDIGLRGANITTMPPEIEALVVKHFDDPRVGAALRAFALRYRTRALFDLHYARIQSAYESREPSFGQILRTGQPGVDEPLLRIAPRFPTDAGQLNPAVQFLARRKYPGAVPLLVAALEASYAPPARPSQYNAVLESLLDYPSIEAWRQANAEIERLKRESRIPEESYAAARSKLDPLMADPDAAIARMRSRETFETFVKRRDALFPNASQISPLEKSDLPRYVEEQARFLEKQEAIAAELGDEQVDYNVAIAYGRLGAVVRFRMRDPARAVPLLEKAAKGRDLYGQIALADTYQLELRDKANALRVYQLALRTASEVVKRYTPYARPGDAMNEFWKAWLAEEVAFLRTGTPFHGRVPEKVIGGFWEVTWVWARVAVYDFPDWAQVPESRADLAARLAAVPASRLALLMTLRSISTLPNADGILRELARNDPSGYWTAIALGTVAFHESRGAAGREEASRNGVAEALPGMIAAGGPNPLVAAARRYLQSRELRVVTGPQPAR